MSIQDQLLRGVSKSRSLGTFIFRQHGETVRAFTPLLLRFGKEGGKKVKLLERAFNACLESGSEASFRIADHAAMRLRKLSNQLPEPEQSQVAIEIERRMQTLNNKRDGFGRLFAESAEESMIAKAARKRLSSRVALATVKKTQLADRVLSVFGDLMRKADAEGAAVSLIYKHFQQVVEADSSSMKSAMQYAADHAEKMRDIVESKILSPAHRLQKLRGYLSKMRGDLGEGYGLLNKVWSGSIYKHLEEAEQIAIELNKLEPGHEVHYLTQLDNKILVNGLEGPDALIVIVNRRSKKCYFHTKAQVKTATTSEGVKQSIHDLLRSAGEQRRTAVPYVDFTLNGKREVFTLGADPLVQTNRYLINATGSTIPKVDIDKLKSLGEAVTELELDMSVDQFTLLAVSVIEAAIKAL